MEENVYSQYSESPTLSGGRCTGHPPGRPGPFSWHQESRVRPRKGPKGSKENLVWFSKGVSGGNPECSLSSIGTGKERVKGVTGGGGFFPL